MTTNTIGKDIVVLYHAECSDGLAAAAVLFNKYEGSVDYLPVRYNEPLPNVAGKEVYILDFSYPPEVLLSPSHGASSIDMWDHHSSALDKWKPYLEEVRRTCGRWEMATYIPSEGVGPVGTLRVILDMNESGASLTNKLINGDTKSNVFINHIRDQDLWKFDIDGTKEFTAKLRSLPQTVSNYAYIMTALNFDEVYYERFLEEGRMLLGAYQANLDSVLASAKTNKCVLNGVEGLAINCNGMFSSNVGNALAITSGTFGLAYYISEGMVKCSVRSVKGVGVDVSKLCESLGGGGHKEAAGFIMPIEKFFDGVLQY